jgi:hypothetical protein
VAIVIFDVANTVTVDADADADTDADALGVYLVRHDVSRARFLK